MINKKFGKLTVIKDSGKRNKGSIVYECKCDCGNTTEVISYKLRNGKTKSCGCLRHEIRDITNERFGRLVAVEFVEIRNSKTIWKCVCDCGNMCEVSLSSLSSGASRSCGCLDREVKQASIYERMQFRDGTSYVAHNRKNINKNNSSGVRGVHFDNKRQMWVAQIGFQNKVIYLGRFVNKEDAIKARKEAEEKYFKQ